MNKKTLISKFLFTVFASLISVMQLFAIETHKWYIVVDKPLASDEAIQVAIDDLNKTGETYDIQFIKTTNTKKKYSNSIVVGSPERNGYTKSLVEKGKLTLEGVNCDQGYEIVTKTIDSRKAIFVSGGSILGEAYGLFWISDRLKVNGTVSDINIVREPELKIRFAGGNSKSQMRQALRYGATWVWGSHTVNHLVPWDSEPERTQNAKNREELKELINYAHSLHLKFIVYEDEFSYHPTLLEEFGASLDPEDPKFWEAVQAKYRRLLQVMPEIDGVRQRTGEATRVGGNYRAFDVMHDGDSNWSLSKRYRTWVKNVYDVTSI